MATRARPQHAVSLSAVRWGALALVFAAGCDQPEPLCSIARGDFSATYTLVSGSGECAMLHGEVLSVQAYTAPRSSMDRRPDFEKTSIAIQPSTLTALLTDAADVAMPNPEDRPYAEGAFDGARPDADFCTVRALGTARVRLPALSERREECTTTPAQPAVDLAYTFSNVRVYTTAAAYGTQFSADLTVAKDGCSATYRVAAVYPSVSCAVAIPDDPADGEDAGTSDGGEPLVPPLLDGGRPPLAADASGLEGGLDGGLDAGLDARVSDAAGDREVAPEDGGCSEAGPTRFVADEAQCSPVADPAHGRALGSGINPDFAVGCDPTLLLCVLKEAPPSLR